MSEEAEIMVNGVLVGHGTKGMIRALNNMMQQHQGSKERELEFETLTEALTKLDIADVKAWVHYYAPEALQPKLEMIIEDAERMREIDEVVASDSLASDGMEMIQSAMKDDE